MTTPACGKRPVEQGTYISPRALYRDDIKILDTDVTSAGIPVLDTRPGPNAFVIPAGQANTDVNMYGKDARINLAVLPGSVTTVTLQLWLLADLTAPHLKSATTSSSSSSGVPHLPATGQWVQVASKVITGPSLWTITDIPPGQYKVLLTAWTGNGGSSFVTIEEQHAA